MAVPVVCFADVEAPDFIGETFAEAVVLFAAATLFVFVFTGCFWASCAFALPAINNNAEAQIMYFFMILFLMKLYC